MASRFVRILQEAKAAFATGRTLSVSFRLSQIKNLLVMVDECREEIVKALNADLRKSKFEATLYEVEVVRAEIVLFIRNLKNMVKDDELPINMLAFLDSGYIQREPYGTVLVIGAWNYPFSLSILPFCGAIAAGNCVILKPSEIAANTSRLLSRIIPRYLDNECYQVYEADVEGTKELLTNKFDYIFATGSARMGRAIMAAAVPNLTPLTLELGGKSPVYIDDSSDFELAAKRIIWGKCINLGQTCISPDYILCSKKAEKAFLNMANRVLNEWYGDNWKQSTDLTRIINEKCFLRLQKIMEETKGNIAIGGQMDQAELWISPTVVINVPQSDILMEEEIFGPILPILTVDTPDEALEIILSRPKPLSLYVFSKNTAVINRFVQRTSSGGVCINDVIWQNGWEGLPFGGVGESGFGNYHGKFTFETFSHKKAILNRGFSYLSEKLGESRYPPYTDKNMRIVTFLIRHIHFFSISITRGVTITTHILAGCIGAALLYSFLHFR